MCSVTWFLAKKKLDCSMKETLRQWAGPEEDLGGQMVFQEQGMLHVSFLWWLTQLWLQLLHKRPPHVLPHRTPAPRPHASETEVPNLLHIPVCGDID